MTPERRIRQQLEYLYGEEVAGRTWQQLERRLADFQGRNPHLSEAALPIQDRLSQRDALLITYGDQFVEPGAPPLESLHRFLITYLHDVLSGVHILPCFPYSSDDGFSVIDYMQVDPKLGDWTDVARIGRDFRLMFDAVINHVSQHSRWFQGFRQGQAPYHDYFITVDPNVDLSAVVRPRALPLLTPAETTRGIQHVWTTFSDDQIDLNYSNPSVQMEIIDVLLHYVEQGAEIIRLDAIAYLWKEIGTSCIHLPQTHAVVRLWRAVLDAVAPGVILITETNVPHEENISYFGQPLLETDSTDEAQMVYNFSLAPLTLHALQVGDATRLSRWAADLRPPSSATTFFNFIASHDGIGIRPAEGILSPGEMQGLVERTVAHGGQASYKANSDGSKSVYELNITLYDFLNDPKEPDVAQDVQRFLASQAILLSLPGVPGIYVHSLFGSRNCHDCLASTGRARSLNREKFDLAALEAVLADSNAHQRQVLDGYRHLLSLRRTQPAFHPGAPHEIIELNPAIFALRRGPWQGTAPVYCLINLSGEEQRVRLPLEDMATEWAARWLDLIGGSAFQAQDVVLSLTLSPYQSMWLVRQNT